MTTRDKEKQKATRHRYYLAHKAQFKGWSKTYYENHKEQIKDSVIHKEQIKAYAESHKEQIAKNKHARYLANREERRVRSRWLGLKNLYGMTPDDYNQMFEAQGGCCLLCGRHQSELKLTLCVDHNHETGVIRGLLCHNCNVAIALLQEDVEILQRAIQYLTEKT